MDTFRLTVDEVGGLPAYVLDEATVQALRASQLLGQFTAERLRHVAWSKVMYRKGDVICAQGEKPLALGLILEGRAHVVHTQIGEHPRDTRGGAGDPAFPRDVLILCSGDTCGEACLVDADHPYSLLAATSLTLLLATPRQLQAGVGRGGMIPLRQQAAAKEAFLGNLIERAADALRLVNARTDRALANRLRVKAGLGTRAPALLSVPQEAGERGPSLVGPPLPSTGELMVASLHPRNGLANPMHIVEREQGDAAAAMPLMSTGRALKLARARMEPLQQDTIRLQSATSFSMQEMAASRCVSVMSCNSDAADSTSEDNLGSPACTPSASHCCSGLSASGKHSLSSSTLFGSHHRNDSTNAPQVLIIPPKVVNKASGWNAKRRQQVQCRVVTWRRQASTPTVAFQVSLHGSGSQRHPSLRIAHLFRHQNVRGSTLNAYAQDARKGSVFVDVSTKAIVHLPLDVDPEAPPLVTHRLSEPNTRDITYILDCWKVQWAKERRMAKAKEQARREAAQVAADSAAAAELVQQLEAASQAASHFHRTNSTRKPSSGPVLCTTAGTPPHTTGS